jgi:CRP-like cAMP-binding protein
MSSLSQQHKRRLLKSSILFKGLTDREVDTIIPATRMVSVNPREELFHKGDGGTELFIVVRGRLKAFTHSENGDEIVFDIMGPGEVIGELAVLTESSRSASIQAIDAAQLLALDHRDLFMCLRQNADACLNLARMLAKRVNNLSDLLADLQFLNLPYRLARKLSTMAQTYGEQRSDGLRIKLKLSQEEWGDLVGATRESINR